MTLLSKKIPYFNNILLYQNKTTWEITFLCMKNEQKLHLYMWWKKAYFILHTIHVTSLFLTQYNKNFIFMSMYRQISNKFNIEL